MVECRQKLSRKSLPRRRAYKYLPVLRMVSVVYDKVEQEIIALKAECGNRILKVIVETCYLTEEEKIAMCQAVTNAGADYIKTSTGFGTGGATLGDVKLFREHIGEAVRIKAAGGVSTREDFEAFLDAGCDRIGSSSGVALLTKKA